MINDKIFTFTTSEYQILNENSMIRFFDTKTNQYRIFPLVNVEISEERDSENEQKQYKTS
jgi:hypothetical protein